MSGTTSRLRLNRRKLLLAAYTSALGLALAVPGAYGLLHTSSDDSPKPLAALPADDPSRGLTYTGLQPAPKGDKCVGGFRVTETGECTHGPDAPPPGIDFSKDPAPVAPAAEAPSVPLRDPVVGPKESDIADVDSSDGFALAADAPAGTAGFTEANGIACEGDGTSGKRVQVLYVRGASTPSKFAKYAESFRTWAAGVDAIYNSSAKETGGTRRVRYVTTPDCKVDVREVEVPDSVVKDFGRTNDALKKAGYARTDRMYMLFADVTDAYCGIGSFAGDTTPGSKNRSNTGPFYGRSDFKCWTASVAAHELGHNLGSVNNNAPNSSKAGHCNDEYDVMCYADGGPAGQMKIVCGNRDKYDNLLDCNHDDYYHTNPKPGSYLARNWNMADSDFLIKGNGGTDPPPSPSPTKTTASPSPTKTSTPPTATPTRTTPPPTATPTGTPTGTGTPTPPTGPKELRVSDTQTNSTRLAWDAAPAGTRYAVQVNGRTIGTVGSTAVRVVGMRPDTSYTFQIVIGNTPWTKTATVKTKAIKAPPAGSYLTLTNALTGEVADLYGSRSAEGTPLISFPANGASNQVWKMEQVAGSDRFKLRSKATDKCVAPNQGRAVEGTPLVQADCATASTWTVANTPHGVALTGDNGLVLGVGTCRFGSHRMLTLQKATGARHQSWAPAAA